MQDAGQSETPRRDRRPVRVPVSLREERRQAIFSLRSAGLTMQAIADQLGLDNNTVRYALSVTGDPRPLSARRPTPCILRGLQPSAGKQNRLLLQPRAATEANRHGQAVPLAPEAAAGGAPGA